MSMRGVEISFKSIVREVRDGIGSMSMRAGCGGGSSVGAFEGSPVRPRLLRRLDRGQGRWADLPPELLRDIMQRVEADGTAWPARRAVVSAAAVCRSWREAIEESVRTPEESGQITFPISLKQPGQREVPIQCFIKRERATGMFYLYLGLGPALHGENGKLLLAARRVRRAASTDYLISLVPDDFSRASSTYLGKLRANLLGTKFTVYDSQPPCNAVALSNCLSSRRIHSRKVSPRIPAGNYSIGTISYELNLLRTRGPRRMQCILNSIPASAVLDGGTAPTPTSFLQALDDNFSISHVLKIKEPREDLSSSSLTEQSPTAGEPLVLKNKAPRWHEQLQCWCLNFRGRVTVASVKNFQLVAAVDPTHPGYVAQQDQVILQFGKIGKDIFTMDYRYPLSAFQAFTICLSSFDTKPIMKEVPLVHACLNFQLSAIIRGCRYIGDFWIKHEPLRFSSSTCFCHFRSVSYLKYMFLLFQKRPCCVI